MNHYEVTQRLHSLKQRGRSVKTYAEELEDLVSRHRLILQEFQSHNGREQNLIQYFKAGLDPELRRAMAAHKSDTFTEFVKATINQEEANYETRDRRRGVGAIVDDIPDHPQRQPQALISYPYVGHPQNSVRCFYCHEVGHIARNCPLQKLVCYLCNSAEHSLKDCPYAAANGGNPRLAYSSSCHTQKWPPAHPSQYRQTLPALPERKVRFPLDPINTSSSQESSGN